MDPEKVEEKKVNVNLATTENTDVKPMTLTQKNKEDIITQLVSSRNAISGSVPFLGGKLKMKFCTLTAANIQDIEDKISSVIKNQDKSYSYITNAITLYNLCYGVYSIDEKKLDGDLDKRLETVSAFSDVLLNKVRNEFLSFVKAVSDIVEDPTSTNFT